MKGIAIGLFFISSLAFGQRASGQQQDNLLKKKPDSLLLVLDKARSVTSNKTDTHKLSLKDTAIIGLNLDSAKRATIYVVKETITAQQDYFKYIFPILTLLLGIVINKAIEYFTDRKKTRKNGERWVAETRALENPMKNQVAALRELLVKEKPDVFEIAGLQMITSLDCEIFKTLDKSDLLKFIERKKKNSFHKAIELSNSLHGFISITAGLNSSLEKKYEEYLSGYSEQIKALNGKLLLLGQVLGKWHVNLEQSLNGDPMNTPKYATIFNLYANEVLIHAGGNRLNPFTIRNTFFIPVIPLLAALRHDPIALELSNIVADCLHVITGLSKEKKYLTENVDTIMNRYQKQIEELKDIIQDIDKFREK